MFEMSPTIQRWVGKEVRQNLWRMPKWMGEEDLRQEGMVYWVVVNNRYTQPTENFPQGVTDIKHMMSLFMASFRHRLHDLASNIKNSRKECNLEDLGPNLLEAIAADSDIHGAILEAPEPVQSILRLLTAGGRRNLGAYARVYLNRCDTVNLRLYRALRRQGFSVEPTQNFLSMVRQYLMQEREALYGQPTVLEIVGATVDDYLCKPRHQILKLPIKAVDSAAPQYNSNAQRIERVKLDHVPIEVVYVRSTINHYPQAGIRRRAPHTKPRVQVPKRAWSPLRPRMHRGWPFSEYPRPHQRGHDCGLRRPQTSNERYHRERLGPRTAVMGEGPANHQFAASSSAAGTSQDCATSLHSNGGGIGRVRLYESNPTPISLRPQVDALAAV